MTSSTKELTTYIRIWDGQIAKCEVMKSFLFMRLVSFRVRRLQYDGTIRYVQNKSKWYPSWRVINDKS